MDSAFARADYDSIIMLGKVVWFDLGESVTWQNWQATSAQQ